MLRSLLVGLVLLALPCASLADRSRVGAGHRAAPAPRVHPHPEARPPPQAREAKHRPRVEIAPPFPARPRPPRRIRRDWNAPARAPGPWRDCHPVNEPPRIALFLLGAGGLALLGRRARRGSRLGPQRSREIA